MKEFLVENRSQILYVSISVGIDVYLRFSSTTFPKELEAELDYPFFTRKWEFLNIGKTEKNYGDVSRFEFYIPTMICLFCAGGFFFNFKATHWAHYVFIVASALQVVVLIIEVLTPLVKKEASDEFT